MILRKDLYASRRVGLCFPTPSGAFGIIQPWRIRPLFPVLSHEQAKRLVTADLPALLNHSTDFTPFRDLSHILLGLIGGNPLRCGPGHTPACQLGLNDAQLRATKLIKPAEPAGAAYVDEQVAPGFSPRARGHVRHRAEHNGSPVCGVSIL